MTSIHTHPFLSHGDNISCRLTILLLENVVCVLRTSAAAPPMPKATNAHNLHTVDMTHVVHTCITSPAQSIEGGALEVTLHQLASRLSFHLLPGWGSPPPDREHDARGPLANLI